MSYRSNSQKPRNPYTRLGTDSLRATLVCVLFGALVGLLGCVALAAVLAAFGPLGPLS